MSKVKIIQRKKPIFYDLFPYKVTIGWMGNWSQRKKQIIQEIGYKPKLPLQRLTNDGFLYFKHKKEFNSFIKKHKTIIHEAFAPAEGYEQMLKKDYKFLWHRRFPYTVKFNSREYFNKNTQLNIIEDINEVDIWCEGNLMGPYKITSSSVFVITMSDALSIKLMYGQYIKEISQKFTDVDIKKMLKQRCIDANDDLEYFENG